MGGQSWSPLVADVARLIPARTRDAAAPGSDAQLGTFTETTTPTVGQAEQFIEVAVGSVTDQVGDLPASHPRLAQLQKAAQVAAAYQAAADIEAAYPQRAADRVVAATLQGRADRALAALRSALEGAVEAETGLLPVWSTPDPPAWADSLLT